MKAGFYSKLAIDGIRKNRRMYLPYLLTCVLMVAMFYILAYLSNAPFMEYMPGSASLQSVMNLGSFVIAAFAVIFLFYTNSFLLRRRKKEFGLFNILGMDKHSISRILFWETLIIAGLSLIGGLGFGIALSKLAELGLTNIIGGDVSYEFTVPGLVVRNTSIIFAILFFLIYLNAVRHVRFSNPVELIRSENVGEKPPKANWFPGILGVLILGAAYYLAVSIENPVDALVWFFVAVILVIVGTYLIFIAGSVLLCRILQKNRRYYYKKNHFISVSSMAYRMKNNGAGLASICILLTMVLVMISSTTCLYFGKEDSLHSRYPRDISARIDFEHIEQAKEDNISLVRDTIDKTVRENNVNMSNVWDYRESQVSGMLRDGNVEVNADDTLSVNYDELVTVHFIPLEDYNRMIGKNTILSEGEALAFSVKISNLPEYRTVGGVKLHVVERLASLPIDATSTAEMIPNLYLVVPDLDKTLASLSELVDSNGNRMLITSWYYGFDTDIEVAGQIDMRNDIREDLGQMNEGDQGGFTSYSCESIAAERDDFYGTYGGLFFLGIMLSIVFLVAAVLIIYYKQISEGYEDQSRFDIMQKVGMTKQDIRKSINSQMLTVFYLPIIFAVIHLGFAFPMIRKLLLLFGLNNLILLLTTTGISIVIIAFFYAVVYRMTSNAYYSIVSGARE
ncbi:ABC transporter permease [Anaerobium acetethylicum]|uniref:Putative ABC transport system permease protein n=1 Tax=Anaerobium acetethylicum TaxID=1619234 RepID=A0A1D3TX83_9FIRM|nr:ABC transporter permease [Anaerobium acetethylicum]SCP98914.1 putative ABC transport system permease protein [Anaerobium acetethylicum]